SKKSANPIQDKSISIQNLLRLPLIIWNVISNIGIRQGLKNSIVKKIKISNQLSVFMLLIISISTFVFASTTNDNKLVYLIASIVLAPAISLILNKMGHTKISRLLISIITPLHILIIIVLLKKWGDAPHFVINEYHFYTPRYFLMALGLLPVFLIDLKEKGYFFAALFINILCLALFDIVHKLAGVGPENFGFAFDNYYQATIMPIVLLVFLYGSLIFYQSENKKYEAQIEKLLDKEKMYSDRIKGEIAIAKTVIDGLIPRQLPKIEGLDIAGELQWSSEVGGDYYNVFQISDREYLFFIADVVGKGLGASILVSTVHSNIETQIDNGISDIQDFIERLNEVLCRITDRKKFITCWAGIYNSETRELKSVNAGHLPPLIISKDRKVTGELTKGGPILGFFDKDEVKHQSETILLKKGDAVFSFTDGVSEANSEKDKMYESSNRLENIIAGDWISSKELINNVIFDVRDFSNSDTFEDDLTCLMLRRIA
ncbi:MAG: PP2C family protein-serine/threonine phosphatase, partial [Chitinophagales bacterium]